MTEFEVGLVGPLGALELSAQQCFGGLRQEGGVVLTAYAIAHDDFTLAEIQVLDAQTQTLAGAQAAAAEQLGDEVVGTLEADEQGADFLPREEGGQPLGPAGAHEAQFDLNRPVEDVLVEEEEGGEGLVSPEGHRDGVGGRGFCGERISVDVGNGGPSKSPDGNWLAMPAWASADTHDTHIIPSTGGERTQVSTDPAPYDQPAWRP